MRLPDAPQPLSLSVKNLSAQIDGKRHIHNVTFSVPAGGTLSVVGPVGSGKSALLWAINGLLQEVPGARASGEVEIDGVPISDISPTQLRQRVGLPIPAPLARTPFGEVAAALPKTPAAEVGCRVEAALRLVGLWRDLRDSLHLPYHSGDPVLLRLLVLARTMVLTPGLLLLDDPTRGLDSVGRARFEAAVASIVAAGTTTLVWATREPDQAGRVARTMAFLCNGELVETGPVETMFERPADARTESFLTGDYRRLLLLLASNEGNE